MALPPVRLTFWLTCGVYPSCRVTSTKSRGSIACRRPACAGVEALSNDTLEPRLYGPRAADVGDNEPRRVRQLEHENARLKRLVADLTLDTHMLAEALREEA